MADISASMVMELRQRTGLGMMECKKALTEADGDLAKAEELLRIKSGAKASKAAGRVAAEGVVGAVPVGGRQVGRDGRGQLRDRLRRQRGLHRVRAQGRAGRRRAQARPTWPRSSALPLDGGTVESAAQALVQKIGENIIAAALRALATPQAQLAQYLHGGGRIGVTVDYAGGDASARQGSRDAHRGGAAPAHPSGRGLAQRRRRPT